MRLAGLPSGAPSVRSAGTRAAYATAYFAAALNLAGCLADRLRFLRLTTAQVAAAFVGIVTPGGAVGGMAVNTRFLQPAGIPVARAVTAVGVSQVLAFTCFILLLVLFTALAGNRASEPGGLSITPSATVTGLIVGVAVLGLIVAAIPKVRAAIAARVRPLITNLWPEVLQVARTPRKLLESLGGAVALPLAATVCLWATVNAVGSSAAFASLGVAYLIAKALGSLFPTPGGVGGVEAALTAGLTAAGVPAASAATSVIVFRLLTAWLPVVPGWFAFTVLQRRGEL